MPSTINASTASGGGIISSADSSGVLELQTAGTTAIAISSAQVVTVQGVRVGRGGGAIATNTALGASALNSNTTGVSNTAVGYLPLFSNTTGNSNIAIGQGSMYNNTTGGNNVAVGVATLEDSTTGNNNTAIGLQALKSNTTASYNTAIGYQAGTNNSTGSYNLYAGYGAGLAKTTGNYNTFVGGINSGYLMTTGSSNTILGCFSGNQGGLDIRTSSNQIVISDGDGNPRGHFDGGNGFVLQGASNAANPYIASFDSALYAYGRKTSGSGVFLANNATSWASTSDERRKDIIEPITDAANKVSQLRAVIGKFKTDEEGTRRPFLIAQDVQAVLPEAVQSQEDKEGQFLGMSYTDVVPLLVAAIKELKAEIDQLKGVK
jgi:hypothetical protein